MSAKKNSQLHNKLAIDLVNNRVKYISLDNMIDLIGDFELLQILSDEVLPAKEILLREISFRMLKQHYLPRAGDRISIYRKGIELDEAGQLLPAIKKGGPQIWIPLEAVGSADENRLRTLYWSDLVLQISACIDRLWLDRIRSIAHDARSLDAEEALFEAAVILRKKYIQNQDVDDLYKRIKPDAKKIVSACSLKIRYWTRARYIDKEHVPTIAEMLIRLLILSNGQSCKNIVSDIDSLTNLNILNASLIGKIRSASEALKQHSPEDIGVFAMLQSMLNDIIDRLDADQKENTSLLLGLNTNTLRPRNSA